MNFRGVSQDHDTRYANKDELMIESMKLPPLFEKQVDIQKVDMDVLSTWITKTVFEIIGVEDEVVANYAVEILKENDSPDARKLIHSLTPFLEQDQAMTFVTSLWKMLLEAQKSDIGIPEELILERQKQIAEENDHRRHDSDEILQNRDLHHAEDAHIHLHPLNQQVNHHLLTTDVDGVGDIGVEATLGHLKACHVREIVGRHLHRLRLLPRGDTLH
ncbi:putative Serine/arginine repetitive matrix protein 1 [Blattamonas nauphoetae]|uniref:Serine/arginine repetitive matrix protein 1 n=1 Tax=Blattamonas nauphoetae TaxID=2049346 RepID=A0ABQ9XYV8_9EUKA|nr:putative Serine/arginine repetitive matrix protein 1 [Blattamonas nauphoetae]